MASSQRRLGAPEWLIVIGALLFIAVLFISAVFDPTIRWLHFFQAWMYIAAIWLGLRSSRWGYFVGISTGGLWDYINLFVTTFLRSGLIHLWRALHGQPARPDQIIAVFAWTGNLLLVIGCVWGYARLRDKPRMDPVWFVATFALCTGFFFMIIALCQPRYLPLIPRILHPHAP
jgi:hypothetical protein